MSTDPSHDQHFAYDLAQSGLRTVRQIPERFDHDAEAILRALIESQANHQAPRELLVVLSWREVQNLVFPPPEGKDRWRFAYAKAETKGMTISLRSKVYFTASSDRIVEIARDLQMGCFNRHAFREEIGPTRFSALSSRLFGLTSAAKTSMALISLTGKMFQQKGFADRPIRDWARYSLETLTEFIPRGLLESRLERFPWEAVTDPASPFQTEVNHKILMANHDADAALKAAIALS